MAAEIHSESSLVPPRPADALLSLLADRIGARFDASTVFGTPVQQDGVTVVPVATGWFAFGAGAGTEPDNDQSGAGGGGGGGMTAVGYIEIKDGESRFVPVVRPVRIAALVGALAVVVLLAGRRSGATPIGASGARTEGGSRARARHFRGRLAANRA